MWSDIVHDVAPNLCDSPAPDPGWHLSTAEVHVMQQRSNGYADRRSFSGVVASEEPQLTVSAERMGSVIEIHVTGELDIAVRHLVTGTVEQVLAAGWRRLKMMRVDLTEVTFIDSAGLRSLTLACEMARERDLAFVLVVARPGPVADLLILAGLKEWFDARSGAPDAAQPARQTRRPIDALKC